MAAASPEQGDPAKYVGGRAADGTREGFGTQIFSDGSKYEGEWKNDMAHGKGKTTDAEGGVVEGSFVENKPHGAGTYVHPMGGVWNVSWDMGVKLLKQRRG